MLAPVFRGCLPGVESSQGFIQGELGSQHALLFPSDFLDLCEVSRWISAVMPLPLGSGLL